MNKEILENIDLETVFQDEGWAYKTSVGRSGHQINAKECPNCGNKKYKVYMNANTGLGNCFVCDWKFSKYEFLKKKTGFTYFQFLTWAKSLAKTFGWKPKRVINSVYNDSDIVLPNCVSLPTSEGDNLDYLKQRGISNEICKYFGLSYCDKGFWFFKQENGSIGIQDFSERIIIPVYDLSGNLVTFQGRDITGNSEKKYLFPAKLPGTGRFLLNGNNVKNCQNAVLVEGFFDVAAVKMAFDEDNDFRDIIPIGSFGKHLSSGTENDQFSRFKQLKANGLKSITIMWDGEREAYLAACNAAKALYSIGFVVRIAKLPLGKDPNEISSDLVRQCYAEADLYTRSNHIILATKNPYS